MDFFISSWLFYAVPLIVIILILTYFWLLLLFNRKSQGETREKSSHVKTFLRSQYDELGPLTFKEIAVALYFFLLVIWFFSEPNFITGWSHLFLLPDGREAVSEATPAVLVLILIMVSPQNLQFWPFRREMALFPPTLMSWSELSRHVPWGLLILRGAGFALAKASDQSGLSDWIGEEIRPNNAHSVYCISGKQMTELSSLNDWQILTIILLLTSLLNELVNNATTASILLPVMKDVAVRLELNPLYLTLPVVLSCNFTFVLPSSCPTNAIVYKVPAYWLHMSSIGIMLQASGMRVHHMAGAGLGMKVIALTASLLAANTWGAPLLGMDHFPEWANTTALL